MKIKEELENAWELFLKSKSKKSSGSGYRDIESKTVGGDVEIDPNGKNNLDFYVFSEGYKLGKNAHKK